jgi:hypothetical protein
MNALHSACASSAREAEICPEPGSAIEIEIGEDIVRAAQTYARARLAHRPDAPLVVTTEFDLAAHTLAACVADRIIDADAEAFVRDLRASDRAKSQLADSPR